MDDKFPIVGIGASAGGIEALEGFFHGLPPNPDAAFVVITHLNREHESVLHEVVARLTPLPVSVAADGVQIARNRVYVMPENVSLGVEAGHLKVRPRPKSRAQDFKPVDMFLSSLAQDQGERSVSVILSGADADGTLGTKAVKEAGGLTLAQVRDGHGPRHPSMPTTAISAGFVDLPLAADEMGPKIAEYARGFLRVATDAENERTFDKARQTVYALLRTQTGHDFSGYKPKTFIRRMQRRMHIAQLMTAEAYIERLQRDTKEVGALFRDLLISVTDFFRDKAPFEKLKELVIPKLFEKRGADETIRVWVPGCATGEEVYSIAILLREHMADLPASPRVQLFATDIDENALQVARAARYPEELLTNVSEERRRFFVSEGGTAVVSKEVRELCIFSAHNLIRDPPFSRMDLISCRNLLIYFGPEVQHQVIPTFHYSLRPNGFLFLGTSENVTQFPELFVAVDKRYRIFRSREDTAPSHPAVLLNTLRPVSHDDWAPRAQIKPGATLRQAIQVELLERLAPPHVVINGDGEIVHYSGKTGKYLEAPLGAPTRQLLAIARRGLRIDLRTAIREAMQSGKKHTRQNIRIEGDDGRIQTITLTAEPIFEPGRDLPLLLVSFVDEGEAMTAKQIEATAIPDNEDSQIERELKEIRERLQSQIEEYEAALEELKSSNEELISMNEEAQSTNEELEASKEEMQSLNEELHTVNSELLAKVEALDRANSDLHNIFESTQIATVFLDKDYVIRIFTPAVSRIFNILPSDRGRPLTDITSRFGLPDLAADVKKVSNGKDRFERVVHGEKNGEDWLIRFNPYRNSDGQPDGVVLSFIELGTKAES